MDHQWGIHPHSCLYQAMAILRLVIHRLAIRHTPCTTRRLRLAFSAVLRHLFTLVILVTLVTLATLLTLGSLVHGCISRSRLPTGRELLVRTESGCSSRSHLQSGRVPLAFRFMRLGMSAPGVTIVREAVRRKVKKRGGDRIRLRLGW